MRWSFYSHLGKPHWTAFGAALLILMAAGCASQSSNSTPTYQQQPTPDPAPAPQAGAPPMVLNSDQMAKVSQAYPDTARRIQSGQPLTVIDVKDMVKVGLNPDAIIGVVNSSHTVFHLTANEVIDLKNSGASEYLIDYLMNTPSSLGGVSPVPEPETTAPTAVQTPQTPPPPPPTESEPPTPGPNYVWVGGDWVWNNGWVWVGGRWALPPYPGAIWYHGGWRRGWRGGWRHDRGRWWH